MSDFSDYPAGAQRDRAIAERKGWADFDVRRPSVIYGRSAPDRYLVQIPAWSTNLNWAWKLFDELPDDCTPRVVRMLEARGGELVHVWRAVIIDNETQQQWEATRDDPADAISQAWMEWEEAMQLRTQAI